MASGIESAAGNLCSIPTSAMPPAVCRWAPAVRALELPSLDEDSLVKVTRALVAQGARLVVLTAPMEGAARRKAWRRACRPAAMPPAPP